MIGPYVHVCIFALNMILIFLTHLIPSWITLTQLSWLTHWSRQLPLCCGPDIRLIIHCPHPCDHNCRHHQWHHYCKHYHPINDRNWWQYSKQTWITKTNNLKQENFLRMWASQSKQLYSVTSGVPGYGIFFSSGGNYAHKHEHLFIPYQKTARTAQNGLVDMDYI